MTDRVEALASKTKGAHQKAGRTATNKHSPVAKHLQPKSLTANLFAGTIAGALTVVMAISYASLVFSGALASHAATGIGLALYSAVVGSLVSSLSSSFPSAVGVPQGVPALIMGIIAATIVAGFPPGFSELDAVMTVVIAMAATTFLTGAFALLLGIYSMGRLIRFIPYPVVGGFLAGTGWLLCRGAVGIMSGSSPTLDTVPKLLEQDVFKLWAPGLTLGLLMLVLNRRSGSTLVVPALLVLGFGVFFTVVNLTGTTLSEVSDQGWLLGPFPQARLWQPLTLSAVVNANWSLILEQTASILAILVVSVTAVLLNATGMELATKTDIDFDRELKSAGIANLVSGLGGGMVCFQAISLSVLARKLGASRLAGIVVAVLCGIALYYGPSFLPFIPKFVLGGVLIYLGASLLVEWLIDARHTLSTMDHLLVVLILTVIATVGFLEGIALGMALAIFLFAFNLSRTSIVKQALSGADQRSSVQRSGRDTRIIDRLGDRIWILELQGYMFFGTANSLLEHARQHLTDQGPRPAKFIVLDFRQLIGIDSSAAFSLRRLEQVADSKGATLIFSHLSRSLSSQLISNGVAAGSDHRFMTFHDLDHALEWCEDQLLGTQEAGRHSKDRPLEDHLKRLLPPTIAVTDLLGYMEKKDFAAGQILVREGDAAEKLYFLQSGRVSVRLKTGDRRTIRLRTMNAGSTVGEIGLYLDRLRSATVVAENPTTVYQLSKDDLIAMEDRHPEVAPAFHKLMVVTQAERLVSLNRLLVALRR